MTASTTSPRGKAYRYYSCTEPHRRGTDACPVRTAPAPELEQFIVQRIKDLGEEPALLREALQSAADQRTREKPLLEKEQRRLQVKLQNLKNDSRKLVDALAAGHGQEVKSITERLTQVDAEAADAERRLCEVRESLTQLELVEVDPNSASMAMMQFTPLWEALTANERTRLVNLLIERVDYDGVEQTIDVSFRPMGLATFAREATGSGELQ